MADETAPQTTDIAQAEAQNVTSEANEPITSSAAAEPEPTPMDTAEDAPANPAAADPAEPRKDSSPKPMETSSPDAAAAEVAEDAGPATATPNATNGTPASSKKRKSTGVPEHKTKRPQKKKSLANLNTGAQAGEYYLTKCKGWAPWPAIVCDEEMLPQALLTTRPGSARQPDGTFKDQYADGAGRENERQFPVMFMSTNEFSWVSNKEMSKYDIQSGAPPKGKNATLLDAYEIAKQEKGLDHWKSMLRDHQQAMLEDKQAKAEKAEKKKRKSEAKVAQEDVDMADVDDDDGEGKSKKGKKRSKGADSDGENTKPSKMAKSDTPKSTKIKISAPKAPNGTPASKSAKKDTPASKSKAKPKSKKTAANSSDDEETTAESEAKPEKKPLSPQEQLELKQKEVLYLRHKLQKCFLSGDQPKEEEMKSMSEFIHKLEQYQDLEVSIIRATKINKVLKGIIKLSSIPLEQEFNFRQRSNDLLAAWNNLLKDEVANQQAPAAEEPKTNGTAKTEEPKDTPSEGEKKSAEPTELKQSSDTITEKKSSADADAGEMSGALTERTKPTEPVAAEETKENTSEAPAEAAVVEASA